MKILITVKSLVGGGAERVASLWAEGFSRYGHDVSVAVMDVSERDYRLPLSVDIIRIPCEGISPLRQLKYILSLRKVIKSIRPDLIISLLNPSALYSYIASLGINIPIINTEHNCFERPKEEPMGGFEYFNKYYINRLFHAVTVLTQVDYNLVSGKIKNIYVLPNPLSFEVIDKIPQRTLKKILAVGRLDSGYCKGFDILLKGFSIVCKTHKEWTLEIIGSGSEESQKKYRNLALQLGIEDYVSITGYTTNILEKYRESEIFVSASRYEGFGMALLEAMSQGCACVSTSFRGRQEEIIREESEGLICRSCSPEILAENILKLINDVPKRRNIQSNAIIRAKDFSIDIIMDKWNVILSNIKKYNT